MSGEKEQAPKDQSTQLAEMQKELDRLKAENIRLRRDLIDPPADVQELVIQKLNLVSADALAKAKAENAEQLERFFEVERYISREHVASWARIEAELGSYDPWKPQSLCDRTIARLKEYQQLIFAVERKHEGETRHQTALRYIREAETFSNQTAAASSVAATRVKSDDHAANQGEQKS